MKKTSKVITLGCRLNICESEGIKNLLKKKKIINTTVINTCAVTNQAVVNSKKKIIEAKKRDPNNRILVTGCASQIEPKIFSDMKEVDKIIYNKDKNEEDFYLNNIQNLLKKEKKRVKNFSVSFGRSGTRTRALLQIQQGCNHRCTFCIIPFGRGNSLSLPLSVILKRVGKLIDLGYKEITITGVDLTSYGEDLPGRPSLGQILKRLIRIEKRLCRIRLSSIDPAELDEDLLELIVSEKKILPHIHFSMQSGDNLILKRMKRRHTREKIIDICKNIKRQRSEVHFGADIIVGFPTESEVEFQKTLDCIEKCNFTNIHAFRFSPKKGTPASRMPQIPERIKIERMKRLNKIYSKVKEMQMKKLIGTEKKILFENTKLSYTDDYFKVRIHNEKDSHSQLNGQLVKVKLKDILGDFFVGEILN
ncbi:MAG: tRNA (N(6)-L-threonylcarbamoyladenosine(37)-C(2))-methylthiotransferase MtaB [Rickettsiales bacterium]|nr:tRNA (N(6)-L-threonylcarbamoyladenosine(37)-C(2))-methylthiotransferase MtaB [Rickettsiales bacterium]OUV53287.1 MAG: tRNA (N(6)-L-threonylcarbamoyladenosine(37)-C(2))-methylthiotransferase MtaB [Rickettsiales bacterium TMED127]|tara:strand:+ start:2747 stop:4006 length:1260 start_codon:yes stop_codon:yes gene_type:complete